MHRWMLALLLGATKLTSLSLVTEDVFWPPVLGLLSLRHLELTMLFVNPRLAVLLADLRYSCLETLIIAAEPRDDDLPSSDLPDLSLHDVATLKSVEVRGWYPRGKFTIPPRCLLQLIVILRKHAQWLRWQRKGCPASMLHLVHMKLQAWPAGIAEMPGLRFLELHCTKMQGQDLAALQHIPHVCLGFAEFSTLLLTSGSWQSLQVRGEAGFSVDFYNVGAFVRGTERFLFECASQEAGPMYRVLRAACRRQGVACHECEHPRGSLGGISIASLSDVKLCRKSESVYASEHRRLVHDTDDYYWPSKAAYPELYR